MIPKIVGMIAVAASAVFAAGMTVGRWSQHLPSLGTRVAPIETGPVIAATQRAAPATAAGTLEAKIAAAGETAVWRFDKEWETLANRL